MVGAQCPVSCVQCIVYSVQCTVYSVRVALLARAPADALSTLALHHVEYGCLYEDDIWSTCRLGSSEHALDG